MYTVVLRVFGLTLFPLYVSSRVYYSYGIFLVLVFSVFFFVRVALLYFSRTVMEYDMLNHALRREPSKYGSYTHRNPENRTSG